MRLKRDWGLGIRDWALGLGSWVLDICHLSFVICHWNFALRPSPLSLRSHRARGARGVSLIEVLISCFVLSVGMLGLAALLPIGRMTIMEATKADRSGDCGRAGLRDLKIRRMLDSQSWAWYKNPANETDDASGSVTDQQNILTVLATSNEVPLWTPPANPPAKSFLIDPLYRAYNDPYCYTNNIVPSFGDNTAGVALIPRFTMRGLEWYQNGAAFAVFTQAQQKGLSEPIFLWPDDMVLSMPEEMSPPQPIGRPRLLQDITGRNVMNGDYSWFATVTPANRPTIDTSGATPKVVWPSASRVRFTVSIVVCHRRDFLEPNGSGNPMREKWVDIPPGSPLASPPTFGGLIDGGIGGGTVQLSAPINDDNVKVKENDWVALCSKVTGNCKWYRVVGVGEGSQSLTLAGPDWQLIPRASDSQNHDYLVAPKGVIGVYTTTVEMDQDPAWKN